MRVFAMPLMAGACLAVSSLAAAQVRELPFTDGGWQVDGKATVERHEGRDVLTVENGAAFRRDVALQDGTIEFDVQLTRRRSFLYVMFRVEREGEFEEMYLRPHKSGLPDAVQYAPVFQGQSAWQLYHGPGGTAALEFQPGAWTHVRVVLQGRRGALFVGDSARPVMVVPRLVREPRAGHLGLRAFLPAGSPGEGPIARYANVVVRPGEVPFDFGAPAAAPDLARGVIRTWAVSAVPTPAESAPVAPPALAEDAVKRVDVEPQGFAYLHRHVPLAKGSRSGTAAARVHVRAAREGLRAFDLGFSDTATVFLRGRPVATVVPATASTPRGAKG